MLAAAGASAVALVSGGSSADPRTPAGLPGMPAPFLGTAVTGSGGLTAAIDAYGDVVDLRAPGPGGRALIDNPADRQAAGTVEPTTGIVPRLAIGGRAALRLWQADSVAQSYRRETNVVRTVARFGSVTSTVLDAALGGRLASIVAVRGSPGTRAVPTFDVDVEAGADCRQLSGQRWAVLVCDAGRHRAGVGRRRGELAAEAARIVAAAADADRRWISRARPLDAVAPAWADRMYRRSLLTLRALSDRRGGALVAGARDGWAYVWPRDAATAALALAAAGYDAEARRAARFLLGLEIEDAARFHEDGTPVAGREAQGDAPGWVEVAARAAGFPVPNQATGWRERADYQEGAAGDYLGNAIARSRPLLAFQAARGLVRRAADPGSGLDAAAGWAVRPFPQRSAFPAVRRTLLQLAARKTRFGIVPGEGWPGADPWTAPTAWSAWSLAALGERRAALRLLADLRRAAAPAGALPERVDARTGIPRSTTPLAWPHAFAILALRQLWP